ncbi:MAG: tyrosine--tRNA ligase [bacterium]
MNKPINNSSNDSQKDTQKILELLTNGTSQILPKDELQKKLAKNKPLRIKFGMDPTSPDLHLGHAVVLNKLRQLQDLGHEIIILIGDFTARIGDPSGQSKTRPQLSEEAIKNNSKTYVAQVSKILDPDKIKVHYNSEWLSKITLDSFIKIAGKVTVARIIEREDFKNRLEKSITIGFHELMYPIIQGYDSVALKADIELGGTDQTFNLLVGRFLQEQYDQEPQVIMTLPLLEGLDGQHKMSKSLGNHVGLYEDPQQAYGKIMSISDTLMWRYYNLLLSKTETDVQAMQDAIAQETQHPMNIKKQLAFSIIERFWSKTEAQDAQKYFEAIFQKQDYSKAEDVSIPADLANPLWVIQLLKELGAIKTSSEGKRLIETGAVTVNGEPITEFNAEINHQPGMIIKVGKHRIYKIQYLSSQS